MTAARDFSVIARAFGELCAFRRAPQDIPASGVLLVLMTLANLALSTTINHMQLALGPAFIIAAVELCVLAGLTAALLYYRALTNRVRQTVTALMGCGAFIGAVVLALLVLMPQLPALLRLLVFFWNLAVIGHILRHAMDIHPAAGFIIAIGYAVVIIQLVVWLDGIVGGAAR